MSTLDNDSLKPLYLLVWSGVAIRGYVVDCSLNADWQSCLAHKPKTDDALLIGVYASEADFYAAID